MFFFGEAVVVVQYPLSSSFRRYTQHIGIKFIERTADRSIEMARRKSVPEHARLKKRKQNDVKLDREISALQNTNIPMIPKLPFSRLVREIMQQHQDNYRISAVALNALQESCEYYLSYLFSDAYLLTYHRRRVTLDRSDIRMVMYLRKESHK